MNNDVEPAGGGGVRRCAHCGFSDRGWVPFDCGRCGGETHLYCITRCPVKSYRIKQEVQK